MPSRGQNGGAMNDNFAQHAAQTPSPSTGSRQEMHIVGSAMSSASRGRCASASRQAPSAPRRWLAMERGGDASASMGMRLALAGSVLKRRIARDRGASVPTGMVSNPTAAPILFDRALLRARIERARRGEPVTFLLDRVAEDMEERLKAVMRSFADAAEIWTPGELLRKPLADRFRSIRRIDLDQSETLPLQPASLDLAISALAFQFVNDLPGVLAQIRRALKPDGLLLAAMVGGDTLTELRQSFAAAEAECEGGVSPRVAPFADLRDIGSLLQRAGLALPVTDVDRVVVRYDSAFALMADLRRMGATNILIERRRTPTRRATMLRMAQIYGERFADADGRIRATFDVIWLSGWAPHESQQKPLKPGSAKASLEAAVKGKKRD